MWHASGIRSLTGCCFLANLSRIDDKRILGCVRVAGVNVARRVSTGFKFSLALALAGASAGAVASERWADYAVASLMPGYDWAERDVAAPSLLDARRSGAEAFVGSLRLAINERTTLEFGTQLGTGGSSLDGSRVPGASGFAGQARWNGLERRQFSASLEHAFSDDSIWSAGVLLVHQSYASAGFAGARAGFGQTDRPLAGFERLSYGTGVRFGLVKPLTPELRLDAEFRSRVDMDALLGYRGLYGDVGDFDLPAAGTAALGLAIGPRSELSLGVSRVLYSEVPAFTSNLLPTRLLALLGDGTSPAFRWRDLTVYSLDWRWQPQPGRQWLLHYATSQQPRTSSALLSRALEAERSGYSLGAGYLRESTDGATWRVGLSWAPVSFLHGNSLRQRRDLSGPMVEVESVWTVPF